MNAQDNLFTRLSDLIQDPDTLADIRKLVDLANPMKKYLQTDKGKLAKKRAQERWLESEKGRKALAAQNAKLEREKAKDHTEDVKAWLVQWAAEHNDGSDDSQYTLTLTNLWKQYTSKITRKQFAAIIDQIPAITTVNKWFDMGKTHYTPALRIDLAMLTPD